MKVALLITNSLLAIVGLLCVTISAYYLVRLGHDQSDKLAALIVLLAFWITLTLTAIGNLTAIKHSKLKTSLYTLNLAVVISVIVLLITESASASPDSRIWFGMAIMVITNFALLWRFCSSAMRS